MSGFGRRALLTGLSGAVLVGCGGSHVEYAIHSVYEDPASRSGDGSPFRTGQLILSEAPGPYGILFTFAPERFFRFTHSALVVMENGEPFVYDMSAEFKPTLAREPAGSLVGGVRRTPLADYVGMHLYVEVFEPPANVDRARVEARVKALRDGHVEFDAGWDYYEHSRMFCSEFVVEALAAGGLARPPLVPLTHNPSLRTVLTWFGVTASESLPAAAIPRERRVAAFSVWPNRACAEAYLQAKLELYERFTPDQNIGNLLELDRYDVKLRPTVAEFLQRAPELYLTAEVEPPPAEIRERVRALAVEVLGRDSGPARSPGNRVASVR